MRIKYCGTNEYGRRKYYSNINQYSKTIRRKSKACVVLIVAFKLNRAGCEWVWCDVAKLSTEAGAAPLSNRLWIKPVREGETLLALIPG